MPLRVAAQTGRPAENVNDHGKVSTNVIFEVLAQTFIRYLTTRRQKARATPCGSAP